MTAILALKKIKDWLKDYLPVVGFLVAAAILAFLVISNQMLREQKTAWELEKALLKKEVALITAENKNLRLEAYANLQALKEREKTLTDLTNQTETLRQEFEKIYANNEPCAVWADTRLPGPVLDRLRR